MPRISTYVFFDIETTGLPWQERNTTKIIEFSFIATLREDLELTQIGCMPPVSKLTFVFNPLKDIHSKVTEMTGLSNNFLKNSPTFGQKVKSIMSFLEELPKPACLVAHNGNNFDFKILLAECKDALACLPGDLLCVDSLVGFRKLFKGTTVTHDPLVLHINNSAESNDLLTDDEDSWPDLNISNEEWLEIDDLCNSLSDVSCEEEEKQSKNCTNKVNTHKKNYVKKNSGPKESYTLSALYKRLLNKEEINAHRAEFDCIMMLQCVVAVKSKFLSWADDNCKPLTEIKPLIRY